MNTERYEGNRQGINELPRITLDPEVMGGKPCIRGLRVTVGTIVGLLAVGHSIEDILRAYPYLEEEDIRQALAYAAWRVEEKEPSAMFQKVAPMFLVDNVDQAVAWYRDMLGAKLQHSLPGIPPLEWASLLLGDIEVMFSQKKAAQKWYSDKVTVSDIPANFIAYVYVKDVDSLYERVRGPAEVIMAPVDQDYGLRELAIRDPFGFILIFAQVIG